MADLLDYSLFGDALVKPASGERVDPEDALLNKVVRDLSYTIFNELTIVMLMKSFLCIFVRFYYILGLTGVVVSSLILV